MQRLVDLPGGAAYRFYGDRYSVLGFDRHLSVENCGYTSILWTAGLEAIPVDQYEAARVDGAGTWQQFWHITWPELQPTLALTLILSLLNAFKVFREAYLVAGRYPQQSIYLLQHLFNNWF